MRLYFRVRGGAGPVATLFLALVSIGLLDGRALSGVNLLSLGQLGPPISLLVPALFSSLTCATVHGRLIESELTAVRNTVWRDRLYLAVLFGCAVGGCLLMTGAMAAPSARNFLIFGSFGLLVRSVAGNTAGAGAPVFYALVLLTLGRPGGDQGLSLPLLIETSPAGWMITGVLFASGLLIGTARGLALRRSAS